ncbi:Dabb family protein [uncultured Acetobacteroides sp.]|uniref:Dabb family protein n=1 Tax=uncultured Acetobacteroides sp. TaxID=1760811 RepID=UPI0029F4E379|nr:Dabb family protein [uncultured Acetobacteroides sp.]
MVKHVVCWKLKDEAEGNTKLQNALIAKEKLEDLREVIDEIRSIRVGINAPGTPEGNWDLILESEFTTLRDLDTYANHPDHLKVVEFIKKVVEGRICVDYAI